MHVPRVIQKRSPNRYDQTFPLHSASSRHMYMGRQFCCWQGACPSHSTDYAGCIALEYCFSLPSAILWQAGLAAKSWISPQLENDPFLSATGVAGFNTLTYVAVQYTGSINASLMNSATPIIVVLLTWLVMKERLAWSALPGILVSMAGVSWIISHGSVSALWSLSFNKGDLFMLVAVLCWALYSVGMKKMSGRFPSSPFLLIQMTVALALLLPLSAVEWALKSPRVDWSPPLVIGLIYIGLFASIVAFLSWNRAIAASWASAMCGFSEFDSDVQRHFCNGFYGRSVKDVSSFRGYLDRCWGVYDELCN